MASLVRSLLSYLPTSVQVAAVSSYRRSRDHVKLARAFLYDWSNYRRDSGFLQQHVQGVIEARIIKAYHRVEKGLALPAPRPGFGRDAVLSVLDGVDTYLQRFGSSHTTARALHALGEYANFGRASGSDLTWLDSRMARLEKDRADMPESEGGTRIVHRDEIHAKGRRDLSAFFSSRYSIRHFSGEPVDDELIRQAVLMAKKAPSVCNREAGCVYVASDANKKQQLLALQNGNRGFGEHADRIIVITSRMDTFLTVGERYQCWIDGGLFAMSLVYAMHSLGLGTCCLNWSVEPKTDLALKRISGIPKDHAIIMLLAVGHLPDTLRVAQSPRRPLKEVLHFI